MDRATLEMPIECDTSTCPSEAIEVIEKLLERDPTRRLGAHGAEEIKAMPFFASMDWTKLKKRQLNCPFKPLSIVNAMPQSSIGAFPFTDSMTLDAQDVQLFEHWTYCSLDALQTECMLNSTRSHVHPTAERSMCCAML